MNMKQAEFVLFIKYILGPMRKFAALSADHWPSDLSMIFGSHAIDLITIISQVDVYKYESCSG